MSWTSLALNMDYKIKRCIVCAATLMMFLIFQSALHSSPDDTTGALSSSFSEGEAYMNLEGENVPFPFSCTTCALVGYSGHLREQKLGKEIDEKHSCIFRMGFSPAKEDYVGSRTTARIVDSFRFYPFLKKAQKLMMGSYSSQFWFLFDWKPGDITRFHSPFLREISSKHDSRFFWLSRPLERKLLLSLADISNKLTEVSSLWFATSLIRDAKCQSLDVYGITSPNICKKNFNVSISSFYWDDASEHICVNGVDSSSKRGNSAIPLQPSPLERKVFYAWASENLSELHFRAPQW